MKFAELKASKSDVSREKDAPLPLWPTPDIDFPVPFGSAETASAVSLDSEQAINR
ncbi:hypothetical protein ACVCIC_00855 [Burkholderia glumae]